MQRNRHFQCPRASWSASHIDILNLCLPQKIHHWYQCYRSYHPKINHPALHPHRQGSQECFRGPGQNIILCSDCFNRVFDCSIRVCWSFGAHKQSGAQGKMPQLPPPPPPLGGPARHCLIFYVMLHSPFLFPKTYPLFRNYSLCFHIPIIPKIVPA